MFSTIDYFNMVVSQNPSGATAPAREQRRKPECTMVEMNTIVIFKVKISKEITGVTVSSETTLLNLFLGMGGCSPRGSGGRH